jgi:chromosome segregation ATPase
LQRKIQQMTSEIGSTNRTITTIENRLSNEETRGNTHATTIGHLESSQTLLTQTVAGQMQLLDEKMEESEKAGVATEERNNKAREEAKTEKIESNSLLQSMLQRLLNNNNSINNNSNNNITPPPLQTNITNNHTAQQVQIYGGGASTQNTVSNN